MRRIVASSTIDMLQNIVFMIGHFDFESYSAGTFECSCG